MEIPIQILQIEVVVIKHKSTLLLKITHRMFKEIQVTATTTITIIKQTTIRNTPIINHKSRQPHFEV